jgi:cellobiose phosphorylase
LGLQRHYDGLHIQPAFPKHWKTVDATRNFRGNKLKLRYVNKGGSSVALKVDGKLIEGNVVPLFSDFGEHTVEVTLV